MPRINKTHQAPRCTWVTLQKHNQSYRLAISRKLFVDDQTRYVSLLSCRQNESGLRKAHQYQLTLQDEIDTGIFDASLQKYEVWKNRAVYEPLEKFNLGSLWLWWLDIKKPLVGAGTFKDKYAGTYQRVIKKVGVNLSLNTATADKLYSYLIENINNRDSIRLFNELAKACNRAIELKLMGGVNPFIGYAEKIIAINRSIVNTDTVDELLQKTSGKVAYTASERDAIIEWFVINKPHYAEYIYFKFYTGCRFGESIELRWNDLSANCKIIFFRRAYVEKVKEIKTTKTGSIRRFNCSRELADVLMQIKNRRRSLNDNDLIFKSETYRRINKVTVATWWNKAIQELISTGKITGKLSQNHTRHTFNEIARQSNDKADVAAQLGHSPRTADLHYSNRGDDTKVLIV
jgi:integrase